MYKNTFFNEAYGATASVSLSQAVCLDFIRKNSKWHQLRQYFWQYCRLWKCFLLIEMLGSHHPEQVLKIWNILIGGVSLPLNLNHKCCKLLHSSCGSRRFAEFSCWSKTKKKKKKKRAGLKIKVWVKLLLWFYEVLFVSQVFSLYSRHMLYCNELNLLHFISILNQLFPWDEKIFQKWKD